MRKTKKKEIELYLDKLFRVPLTLKESESIRDYVIEYFMEIKMRKDTTYSLELFNAYLDDNNLWDFPRFRHRYHDPRQYLSDGRRNPNFDNEYYIVL